MELKNLLNKKISSESVEKFLERVDTALTYLLYITAILLVITHLTL